MSVSRRYVSWVCIGYATIHNVSNREQDTAAIQSILQFVPVDDKLSTDQADHFFDTYKQNYIERVDTDIADKDMTEQLNDHDNIDIVSDISDCDTEPNKSSSQVQSPSHTTPLI